MFFCGAQIFGLQTTSLDGLRGVKRHNHSSEKLLSRQTITYPFFLVGLRKDWTVSDDENRIGLESEIHNHPLLQRRTSLLKLS